MTTKAQTLRAHDMARRFHRGERPTPEDISFLQSFRFPGPQVPRDENGNTIHNINIARAWCAIEHLVDTGMEEGDALAKVSEDTGIDYDLLAALWPYPHGRDAIIAILKAWGRLDGTPSSAKPTKRQ